MSKVDKFILVDHVQFSTKGFQNRNRIRTSSDPRGWAWLTVPVITSDKGPQKISEVKIDNSTPWARQHWKAIYFNYKKTPFFAEHESFFKELYAKKWDKLADLNETIIYYLNEKLGIKVPLVKSSEYDFKGHKSDLIVELCNEFKADTYLSGPGLTAEGGKHYIEEDKLKENNIQLKFSDFKHPAYPQRFAPFIEKMSAIDLLFNCGPKSLEIIKASGNKELL